MTNGDFDQPPKLHILGQDKEQPCGNGAVLDAVKAMALAQSVTANGVAGAIENDGKMQIEALRKMLMEHSDGLTNQAIELRSKNGSANTFYMLMDTAKCLRVTHSYLARLLETPKQTEPAAE